MLWNVRVRRTPSTVSSRFVSWKLATFNALTLDEAIHTYCDYLLGTASTKVVYFSSMKLFEW